MKKRLLSILLTLSIAVSIVPLTVYAVGDATKNSAKENFGLTNEKVNYVYLDDQGAYKAVNEFPHFINAGSGIYHIHGRLSAGKDLPTFQYPNNIEVSAGGTVKLLFDGALDADRGGLLWDYSAFTEAAQLNGQYSMVKIKDGSSGKPTNVEVHFAGKCVISAPKWNAVLNAYGTNCRLTVVLHDDCEVILRGGETAAAIGGAFEQEGRNIVITTDGKYDTSGNRISYKANGKLICYGGDQASAIGSSNWADADSITVESGIVYAYGGYGGAGIGSGFSVPMQEQTKKSTVSNLKITGGTVYATGGYSGAGLGGGAHSSANGITILGGAVEATAGSGAAAIGGGGYGSGKNITISGGRVKAMLLGNYNAHPIGRGQCSSRQPAGAENNIVKVADNTTAVVTTTLKRGDTLRSRYYSCDSMDMAGLFGMLIDEKNYAASGTEIVFEGCGAHD